MKYIIIQILPYLLVLDHTGIGRGKEKGKPLTGREGGPTDQQVFFLDLYPI